MIKLLQMKIIGYGNKMEGVNLRFAFAIKINMKELRRKQKKVEKTICKTNRFQLCVCVCTVILHGRRQKKVRKSDTILGCNL